MRPILENMNIHNSEGGGNEEMGFEIWLQLQILIISLITPTNNYPIGNKSSNTHKITIITTQSSRCMKKRRSEV